MVERPRVIVVGGGFGGLTAAKSLARASAEVLLFDRLNYHLFQPLLYQVATAALSPANIAAPIRNVLRKNRNCHVVMAEVSGIDVAESTVTAGGERYRFDYLVLAAGAVTNYFGHDEWADVAPGLKTIDEATEIRSRALLAFEQAEIEADFEARRAALTFAIVGAGATGVEMAGALAEISRMTLRRDFREIDTADVRVILIDAVDRVLPGFHSRLSERASSDLRDMGVELMLETRVVAVGSDALIVERRGGTERIGASNIIWAAGVRASPLAGALGVETLGGGRVRVGDDLTVPGHPNVFAIGDLAHRIDPRTGVMVPGVAQAAIQMGRFAGRTITAEARAAARRVPPPHRGVFVYRDKGTMAIIGRNRAVAEIGSLRFGGMLAWLSWALIHVFSLIGFRRRTQVMLEWAWGYLTFGSSARLITGRDRLPKPVRPPPDPRLAPGRGDDASPGS